MSDYMNRHKISQHQVSCYLALKANCHRWLTNKELADAAEVSPRTTRKYSRIFADVGIADVMELFPEYKFRISYEGNSLMVRELELAASILKK